MNMKELVRSSPYRGFIYGLLIGALFNLGTTFGSVLISISLVLSTIALITNLVALHK